MSGIRRTQLLAVLAVMLVPACSDSTGPQGFSGRYRLQTIDGKPLPYRMHTTPEGIYSMITEGSLVVESSSSVRIVRTTYQVHPTAGTSPIYRDSVSAQYRSSGDTLFITGYHVAGIDTAFVSGSAVDMPFTYPENAEGPARRIHHFRR